MNCSGNEIQCFYLGFMWVYSVYIYIGHMQCDHEQTL